MQWLQERERRCESRPRSKLDKRSAPLAQIAGNGPQHNAGKDRGSDEAEDGKAKQGVGHAPNSITGEKGNEGARKLETTGGFQLRATSYWLLAERCYDFRVAVERG